MKLSSQHHAPATLPLINKPDNDCTGGLVWASDPVSRFGVQKF
jgi:hypothetical protein